MNAEYRRQIARWTREAMVRKAQAGHVTGGKVFGYDNVAVNGHVERRINEAQAAVVRRIFDLRGGRHGLHADRETVEREAAPAPRPQQSAPAGWSPSSVYEVLHRPLYRGEVVWNKTKSGTPRARPRPSARPESEWLRSTAPDLRIVVGGGVAGGARRIEARARYDRAPRAHGQRRAHRRTRSIS